MELSEKAKPWRRRLAAIRSDATIHWRAPAVMVFSLFSGIVVSFVHHVFNTLINGHSAGGATEQQWVRRVETAFAFASCLLLGISTTTAYTQYLWFYLQRNASRMSSLDAMFSAANNSFRFIHVRLWRSRPILAFIAFMTWALPFAAIFTPGTLTVQPEVHSRSSNIAVPQRHYSDVSYYAATLYVNDSSSIYKGMSVETTRNVGRVQLANALLAVPRPDTNVTYATEFSGPALSCSHMEAADVNPVDQALKNLTESTFAYHGRPFSGSQIPYFGWVPQTEPGLGEVNTSFFENIIRQGDAASTSNLDYISTDAAHIYVYLNTSGLTQAIGSEGQFQRVPDTTPTPPALLRCSLYNASYNVRFDVRATGEQNISATTTFLNWQSTQREGSDNASSADTFSTQALMEAFGWTFTQFIYVLPPSNGSATIYGTHALEMNPALLPVQSNINSHNSATYMMHQMEDFFKNMTLGLRYADLPEPITNSSMTTLNATSQFFRSDYVYEPTALIIAYSISNTFSLLCVLIGIYAIYHNGASFTNNFSTIVRVTNHLDLEESIDEKDRLGSDPLPKHLADTVVGFGQHREQVKQDLPLPYKSASWTMGDCGSVPDHIEWRSSTLTAIGLD